MFHFKCVEEDEDCEGGEDGSAGAVDSFAGGVHTVIALRTEIAVTEDVDDDDEAEEWGRAHDDPVDDDVRGKFLVEYAGYHVVRRAVHYISCSGLQAESKLVASYKETYAKAGNAEVMRFSQRIWTGESG